MSAPHTPAAAGSIFPQSFDHTRDVVQTVEAYLTTLMEGWTLPTRAGIEVGLANELVMALGLAGETGEVADVVDEYLESSICDETNLRKEMGDAICYWGALVRTFGFDGGEMFVLAEGGEPGCASSSRVERELRKLTRGQGAVAEVVKKYLRDDNYDSEKMGKALLQYVRAWRGLCSGLGLEWEAVIRQNLEKIAGRQARGTLRGSGNDR